MLRVAGIFAGVGGIELGLHRAGFHTELLCELDPAARAVLANGFDQFDNETLEATADVSELDRLPSNIDVLSAGFPCQDFSQAGRTRGLDGQQSSLVSHVFRLLSKQSVEWVLLENVPFMLRLGRGAAMRYLASELEALGYCWAYRVVDTRAFGLPHRRQRVFLVASLSRDPARILFSDDQDEPESKQHAGRACGFYWTEGNRGLGWAVDAVPTLKGGSKFGIPSPPAIWFPDDRIATPAIQDAERLQGLPPDWTAPACTVGRPSVRWRLVGNAVTVDCAEWIGMSIRRSPGSFPSKAVPMEQEGSWPTAGFGGPGQPRYRVPSSPWPVNKPATALVDFLEFESRELSLRATNGFYSRLLKSNLNRPPAFDRALRRHIDRLDSAYADPVI